MFHRTSTRKWSSPEGYRYTAPYANAILLRFLIRRFTETLPQGERRRKDQLDDAGRSVISNIEEGYKRPTTREYLQFLGYSEASLEEIKGLCRQAMQDRLLISRPNSSLAEIGIDLREFKERVGERKGAEKENSPLNTPLEILYPPAHALKGADLTFEIFLELCNKTEYLFRHLVEALERSGTKEDAMSPMERWRWNQMEAWRRKEEALDREAQEIVERAKREKESGGKEEGS